MADMTILSSLVTRVVARLAETLSATSGSPVRPLPAVGSDAVDWTVALDVTGAVQATLTAGVNQDAAMSLASTVLGPAEGFTDAELSDTLRELVSQAAGAGNGDELDADVQIAVGTPVRTTLTPPPGAWQHDLVMAGDTPPRFVVWVSTAASASEGAAQADAGFPAHPLTTRAAPSGAPIPAAHQSSRNLDVVLDLELPIMVRFGETHLTLDALARLGPGSMIDLERSPEDPVDLLVNGRLIARGEVVVVSGCYGVRVSEVVSAADRLRSLEG
jgi:flagellar motor switch protein FliN